MLSGLSSKAFLSLAGVSILASAGYASTIVLTTGIDDVELSYCTSPWTANAGADPNFSGGSLGGLLGYKDLFTLIPLTSGGQSLVIDSANLTITTNLPAATTVSVYRVTTPWLTGPAGSSQFQVNGHYHNIASLTEWTANPSYNYAFGASDYDPSSISSGTIVSGGYNEVTTFSVTNAVTSLFNSGVNQGFTLTTNTSGYIRSSESGMGPELTINYHYVPEPASAAVIALTGGLLTLRRRR